MSKVMLFTNMTFASWKKQEKDNIFNIVFVCILLYINCATPTNFSLKHIFFLLLVIGCPPNLNPCIFLLIYFTVFLKDFPVRITFASSFLRLSLHLLLPPKKTSCDTSPLNAAMSPNFVIPRVFNVSSLHPIVAKPSI